ncbi:MAG: hypothetical protein ABWZ76_14485 [Acidimicrobiales bacterium]
MPADHGGATDAPLARGVRTLLLAAALLVFLAGVQLFVFTRRTDEYFAWTIASPMTAVFLGASYWSAVGLEVVAARSDRWSRARIAIPAVFVFTAITLVVSLHHLESFHLDDELPLRTRAVTWGWLTVYSVVPVLMLLAALDQRRSPATPAPPPTGLPQPVRATLAALAVLLLGVGAALLVAPEWADGAWPWPLTPLTARAVGAWLVGLGVAVVHARLIDDRPALRPLAVTGVLFGALQGVALLRHGDELDGVRLQSIIYVLVLVVLTSVSAWVLWSEPAGRTGPEPGSEVGVGQQPRG